MKYLAKAKYFKNTNFYFFCIKKGIYYNIKTERIIKTLYV